MKETVVKFPIRRATVFFLTEVPDSKRIKSKTDSIGFNNDIRSFLMDEAEDNLGIRPDSILSFTIGSCGLVPDQPSIQFSTTSILDGLITEGVLVFTRAK